MANTVTVIRVMRLQNYFGPEWLKQAWIGCEIPCEERDEDVAVHAVGIMPKDLNLVPVKIFEPEGPGVHGYCFRQDAALRVLDKKLPAAADWYRNLQYPQPAGYFLIEARDVEIVRTNAPAALA